MSVFDYLWSLAIKTVENYLHEKVDENRLLHDLRQYVTEQKKYHEICDLAEEYDFQGLEEYILNNFVDDLKKRFFSINSKDRKKAQDEIITAALKFSKAEKEKAKKDVSRFVAVSLEILKNAFKKKIKPEEYFLAAEVVDSINEHTDEDAKKLDEELRKITATTGTLAPLDHALQLAQDGDYSSIEAETEKFYRYISSSHPLYPYYGYSIINNKTHSIPTSEEAIKNYPPTMQITGTIKAGEHFFNDPSVDPLNYAYRHQLNLQISVQEAIQFLGGKQKDPFQHEAENLIGKEITIKPREFPPAFPVSIKIENKVFFNYIMLRTQEILDDNTYRISNKEQVDANIHLELWVKIPEEVLEQKETLSEDISLIDSGFTIGLKKEANNQEALTYTKFLVEMSKHKTVHIFSLQLQKDFLFGEAEHVSGKTETSTLEEEVDFLERICKIEKHFNTSLKIPNEIKKWEYNCIIQISDLIEKNEIKFTWSEAIFESTVDNKLKNIIDTLDETGFMILQREISHVNIFGSRLDLKIMIIFSEAIVQDINRIKNLIKYSETGDPIKINIKAGADNTLIETTHIPSEFFDENDEQTVCFINRKKLKQHQEGS